MKQIKQNPFFLHQCVKAFMLLQFLFGYDHGFLELSSKIFKYIIKFICIIISISISMFILNSVNTMKYTRIFWYYLYVLEYFTTVIVVMVMKPNLSTFFKSFNNIDAILNFKRNHYTGLQIIIFIVTMLAISSRISIGYFYCASFPQKCKPTITVYFFSLIPMLAIDFHRVLIFVICYIIYLRLRKLRIKAERKYLNETSIVVCWTKDSIGKSTALSFLDNYKEIHGCLEIAKPLIDALVSEIYKREVLIS